jgi:nicotinamide-nucleotide amidase
MSLSAEVICVGTELLLGEVLNSNAQFLAHQLAELGIPHFYQTVVGDNPIRLKKVLAIACERSRLLIFTGGLGPTPDDLTTETLADFFDTTLVEQPEILEDIARKFAHHGVPLTANNRKQALIPFGAKILPNPIGSAPGIIWQPRTGLTILTFPGVPAEMQLMWRETAVPYLRSQGWGQEIIHSRVLRFWGIPESALAQKVAPLFDLENPTVAPYAGNGEARLRISARSSSEVEALQLIKPVEGQIRQITGLDCYGADDDTLASIVGKLLQSANQTLSVAESCTGGGLGQMVTTASGSSSYFHGGIISYDNQVKISLLGVRAEDLAAWGAVSAVVAEQMAIGVRSQLRTTWGLSITGVAGPGGGTATKPVGLVYIGLAGPQGKLSLETQSTMAASRDTCGVESFECHFSSLRGRDWIRHVSSCTALDYLRRKLLQLTVSKELGIESFENQN